MVLKSAAKHNRSPKSEGLIGAASTFIKTSLSDGIGFSTVVIAVSYTHLTLPTKRIV